MRIFLIVFFLSSCIDQNHQIDQNFDYYESKKFGLCFIRYRSEPIIENVESYSYDDSFIVAKSSTESNSLKLIDFYIIRKNGFFYNCKYNRRDKFLGPLKYDSLIIFSNLLKIDKKLIDNL